MSADNLTKVSRQRRKQIKWRSEGRCVICGKLAASSRRSKDGVSCYCLVHKVAYRELQRKRIGQKRRFYNCESYQQEARQHNLCPHCSCSLTSTDHETGRCTQCGSGLNAGLG